VAADAIRPSRLLDHCNASFSTPNESATGAETLVLKTPGKLSAADYDGLVADLVNYLVYMSEPARETRILIGYAVLIFLGLLFVPVYLLKKEYWKGIHQGASRPN